MKYIMAGFLFFVSLASADAQGWQIGFSTGKVDYDTRRLKSFNESISRRLPFENALTDNFPVTPYVGIEAGYNFKTFFTGVSYAFNSTGSRLTVTDYSGSYYFDLIQNGHLVSVTPGSFIEIANNLKVYFVCDVGAIFSALIMNERAYFTDIGELSELYDFKSRSFFARPHVRLSYEFFFFKVGLSAGYLLDSQGFFHLKGDRDRILRDHRNENVISDWNGFSTGLSIYVVIPSRVRAD
jgi:opacity protein-like surface antigen